MTDEEWTEVNPGRYERVVGEWLFVVEWNEYAVDWVADGTDGEGRHWPVLTVAHSGLDATRAQVDWAIDVARTRGMV